MSATVIVVHKWAKIVDQEQDGIFVVDATSSSGFAADLSPFLIGPCKLYTIEGAELEARNMENSWQYSKLYAQHADANGDPTREYWEWALKGFYDYRAHRYPMGKGAVPLCSYWDGEKLSYIEARKKIYGPLYAEAVQKTGGWNLLVDAFENGKKLYIRDWDGWDMEKHGMNNLTEVLNNPRKKMGHAFVLKMLLENDVALKQMSLR